MSQTSCKFLISTFLAGVNAGSAQVQTAEDKAFTQLDEGSIELPELQDNRAGDKGLNTRPLFLPRAAQIAANFTISTLLPSHTALRATDAESDKFLLELQKDRVSKVGNIQQEVPAPLVLRALLTVLRDRDGRMMEKTEKNSSCFNLLRSILPVTADSAPLNTEELARKGLLLTGGFPKGLKIEPVTGNHSNYAGRLFMQSVSLNSTPPWSS